MRDINTVNPVKSKGDALVCHIYECCLLFWAEVMSQGVSVRYMWQQKCKKRDLNLSQLLMFEESICLKIRNHLIIDSIRVNALSWERRGYLISVLFYWAKHLIGFSDITWRVELTQCTLMAGTGSLQYLWASECFLKEFGAFLFWVLILAPTFYAKMLKHHLECFMIRKCHLLFFSWLALHYITSLD